MGVVELICALNFYIVPHIQYIIELFNPLICDIESVLELFNA